MSDLISRQEVLNILSWRNSAWDAYSKVVHLPSAEPEIVRCKDCKYWKVGTVSKICTKGIITSIMNRGNEFCSYAERRTNE